MGCVAITYTLLSQPVTKNLFVNLNRTSYDVFSHGFFSLTSL